MTPHRRTALVAGLCYLISFASIPTLGLYSGLRAGTPGPATDQAAVLGALLEVVVALACIGSAVALYPVVRRQGEAAALGFVAARTLEAAMVFGGVANILSLVALRRAGTSDPASALVAQATMVHYDMSFTLGQSLMPGINALLLASLLLRGHLVPRAIPLIGLFGAPLHLAAVFATMGGLVDRISPITGLAAMPIAAWEFALGVYLVGWGNRTRQSDPIPVGGRA